MDGKNLDNNICNFHCVLSLKILKRSSNTCEDFNLVSHGL